MALYKISIKTSAGKELAAVGSKADRQRIVDTHSGLAANPRPHGAEKLAGYSDRYRIRQGNFRIIYLIDDDFSEVTIFKIGDRKDVYRKPSNAWSACAEHDESRLWARASARQGRTGGTDDRTGRGRLQQHRDLAHVRRQRR